ncbi:MAG: hypothetical protein ABIJ36_00595 [Patescibacteria group bacterium]|nr:hypothetical protein [Patescibacteria group bacterium]
MRTKGIKQQAIGSKWDWQFVAKSYLALAYIGVEEMREKKYCNQPTLLWRVSKQTYDAKLLLIPIIWNIKHAIELVLKTHSVTFQKGYFKTHNLRDLKDGLAKILSIQNQSKDKKFDELVRIVDKYYSIRIFNGKLLNSQTAFDTDNDIFRYPEGNKAKFELNLKLFGTITDEELVGLQKEVDLINCRLNIPTKYKHLKPYWNNFSKGS